MVAMGLMRSLIRGQELFYHTAPGAEASIIVLKVVLLDVMVMMVPMSF